MMISRDVKYNYERKVAIEKANDLFCWFRKEIFHLDLNNLDEWHGIKLSLKYIVGDHEYTKELIKSNPFLSNKVYWWPLDKIGPRIKVCEILEDLLLKRKV